MDSNVLKSVEEISGYTPRDMIFMYNDYERMAKECEFYNKLGTVEELAELVEAKRDGRLVVLPCKVGDKVKVDAKTWGTWGNVWNFKTVEYGKFLIGEIVSIIITRKQMLMKIQVEHNVSWKRERKRYPVSAFGITVFPLKKEDET